MDKKTLNYTIHSSKKCRQINTNQIKSIIMLQSTRSVQEMESLHMRNASHLLFCTFLFQKQQKHDIKKTQKNI